MDKSERGKLKQRKKIYRIIALNPITLSSVLIWAKYEPETIWRRMRFYHTHAVWKMAGIIENIAKHWYGINWLANPVYLLRFMPTRNLYPIRFMWRHNNNSITVPRSHHMGVVSCSTLFIFIKTYTPRIAHQTQAVSHEVLLHTTTITC